MTPPTAVVVGAGIGGLTAAAALRRVGWSVRVLERSPEPQPTGAGIVLLANAMRCLDEIGAGDAIRGLGAAAYPGGTRTASGRWLARVDAERVAARFGSGAVVIHRAQLHDALAAVLGPDGVTYGAQVTDVEREPGPTPRALVRYLAGGTAQEVTGDVVVAADGAASALRGRFWPGHADLEYTGSTAWRAVASVPPGTVTEMSETWAPGGAFGIVPMADGRVYWFATALRPAGGREGDGAEELAEVRRLVAGWHDPIEAVLAATPPEAVLRHDISALRHALPSYVRGPVALVGDAAHAMPPNLGQGGSQAIEDGIVLAASLATAAAPAEVRDGLARYDAQRRPRSQQVQRLSWAMARFGAQLRHPAAVATRDAMVRIAPSAAVMRAASRFAGWVPPSLAAAAGDAARGSA
ncbi:monooxygenase FAD-binding [Beutenbergia cavernae DSM 12333]|uniref:Monooxygenase FAD-binding n=1 Tax=Beutenbergia cavernae (strain ATCC BAA-8 / DSM 12333 / CCUG 43141 / JCM 11478 / NBRC 16432 / NCIMB 13614 / HKI 0122) TaxID=471853 RepID=C5BVQ4_BEUC1|nr:monooxygenase FAD-binding [Beutenbergia cavernae DSM 12333]